MSEPSPEASPSRRRGRPVLSPEEKAAREEARRERSWQAPQTRLTWRTRREQDEAGRHFASPDRFSVSALAAGVLPDRLEAPRPVDFLLSFRCDPAPAPDGKQSRVLAAADHVVLEMLIAGARTGHLALETQIASVPVAAVLAPFEGGHDEDWLRVSLGRLASKECVLPGLRQPRFRMTLRRLRMGVPTPEEAEADPRPEDAEFGPILAPKARHGQIPPEAPKPSRAATLPTRMPMLPVRGAAPRPVPHDHPPTPAPDFVLFHRGTPEREFDWWGAPVHRERRFVPVVRWSIVDGVVWFELARWMRHWLNAFRLVDHARAPYALVDIRQMASFRSPYSAPIYRRLVAETYDPAIRNSLLDGKVVEIPTRELAELAGWRPTGGGLFSEMDRGFLKKVAADFDRMGGRLTMRWLDVDADRKTLDKSKVRFFVHAPLDVARMRAARTWKDALGRTVPIDPEDLKLLAPFDREAYHVPAIVWLKLVNRLKIDRSTAMRMAEAWRLALDEALHLDHPVFGLLTDAAATRRARRQELLRVLREEGAPATAFRFVVEELEAPDLSDPDMLDVLQSEGVVGWAAEDRTARYHHEENGTSGEPPVARRVDLRNRELAKLALWKQRKERREDEWLREMVEAEDRQERSEYFRDRRQAVTVASGGVELDAFDGKLFLEFEGERMAEPVDLAVLRRDAVRDDKWTAPIGTADELNAYLGHIYAGMNWRALWVRDLMEEARNARDY
ncbi:hypothetical protein [Aureimonas sp. N4]|uniref:hypothetical protein n=1 Tax=Aureimonas sp. N4 TaxID=1638165 RepID=UPI00178CECE5|nr:hypothetical protein [Aureimonas sp. N4]